jgi:hypothetical protein
VKAKLLKCEFGATNVQYLGFRLTPEIDKLKAVKDTKMTKNVKEVWQFTGPCNFFRSQIKNLASSGFTTASSADQ